MKVRYRFMLGALLACLVLFYMSGAPLQRGWPLWAAGIATMLVTLLGFGVGLGIERAEESERRHDE